MRQICFSLWGDNPKYIIGAIENAKLAKIIYPGWVCKFYIGNDISEEIEYQLTKHDCIIERINDTGIIGSLWRFCGMNDNVEYYICRDADSRLNLREKAAVDEWISSGKSFHIMKDHYYHKMPILACSFGCVGNTFKNIKKMIDEYIIGKDIKDIKYGIDEKFLKDIIYPMIKDDSMVHDLHTKWPVDRIGDDHVGSIYNGKNQRITKFRGLDD